MLTTHSIFEQMNKLGADKVPFFFMIDFLKEHGEVIPLADLLDDIQFSMHAEKQEISHKDFLFAKHPISYEDYQKQFKVVHDNLMFGNSYLTNLTCATPIKTNLSIEEIYKLTQAKYKLNYKNQFVCFSPEIFVQIKNGKISSYPMKGTIDASIPYAKEIILNDEKEAAEHATIVDLIRNDLSLVSNNVTVTNYRFIDELITNDKTLLQVSSEIVGDLEDDFISQIGTIFDKLLPAGSICGAPKKKTVEIILEAENYNRNFYTGVFGVFDGENVDSAVMIRFIEQENNQLIFKSGGGITAKSECESEFNEMIQKVYVPIY
ncbi:aminodeoxychorismate synthase component I [Faecalibacter macacae]|uniref:Aminodeoxychorismate synthase component I n=1 Tax=Faecalibacter macacae TaxID=1859289 RepID=A0A3L9MIJ5_9FLAO|nr:aminodeoxychorismate synthase component I [Faecalibacter macacae]RLZ12592.1 aminodeoxychorismate synthase component I [Faecalibacter macacae]